MKKIIFLSLSITCVQSSEQALYNNLVNTFADNNSAKIINIVDLQNNNENQAQDPLVQKQVRFESLFNTPKCLWSNEIANSKLWREDNVFGICPEVPLVHPYNWSPPQIFIAFDLNDVLNTDNLDNELKNAIQNSNIKKIYFVVQTVESSEQLEIRLHSYVQKIKPQQDSIIKTKNLKLFKIFDNDNFNPNTKEFNDQDIYTHNDDLSTKSPDNLKIEGVDFKNKITSFASIAKFDNGGPENVLTFHICVPEGEQYDIGEILKNNKDKITTIRDFINVADGLVGNAQGSDEDKAETNTKKIAAILKQIVK